MSSINKIIIRSISVKNFRSIKNDCIDIGNMNVFVGNNDAGKSNYLKALNLFFNNETDYHMPFNFKRDFTRFYNPKSHGAKQIEIELKFEVPNNYKDSGIYTWKKIWHYTGELDDQNLIWEDGKPQSERSRVRYALKHIVFRYVPAVKSKEYFKSLLSDLYVTASTVLDNPLEASMKDFKNVIQGYTEQIHDEVNKKIGIDSKISIPSDMSEMFRTMIFETRNESISDFSVPLDMRGDGIQARHIPIILKYIADRDNETRNQGSPAVTTVWGFEEPENGVELSMAYDMAKNFTEYSNDIQMLITTHSPAFYNIEKPGNSDVKNFFVAQNDIDGTKASDSITSTYIDQTLGLMTIVAPYVNEKKKELESINKLILNQTMADIPTILVEGKTDKKYIETAIKLFSPRLEEMLASGRLSIYYQEGQAGCDMVTNLALSWILRRFHSTVLALYDKDQAGIKAKNRLNNEKENNNIFNSESAQVCVQFLQPSDDIRKLLSKGIMIPYEIEHLLSVECWKIIVKRNLSVERDAQELFEMAGAYASKDSNLVDTVSNVVDDEDLLNTIVLYNPGEPRKKEMILNMVLSSSMNRQKKYMAGFQQTINMIEEKFCGRVNK